jgi:hypothetical protein
MVRDGSIENKTVTVHLLADLVDHGLDVEQATGDRQPRRRRHAGWPPRCRCNGDRAGTEVTLPGELTGTTHVQSTTTLTSAGSDRLAEQVPNPGATTRMLKRVRATTALS